METYQITFRKEGYVQGYSVWKAASINNLRKRCVKDIKSMGNKFDAVCSLEVGYFNGRESYPTLIGKMYLSSGEIVWSANHEVYFIGKDGSISKTAPKRAKKDYTKYTAAGFPIYKIWKDSISKTYDCLAKNKNGEWAYGRDYNIKTGIWQGGRYDFNIDNLYKRVGGTFGKVVVNNKRGSTGRF